MATRYVGSYERLMQLPEVFSLSTLVRFTGMSRDSAKVLASRWNERGLVASAGPRAGVYFNRVRDPSGHRANAIRALVMKYPSATLCGASVLHAAGWTTQIPSAVHVAIETRPSYSSIDGVTLHPRPVAWFRFMHQHDAWQSAGQAEENATYGLRALAPAWALADLYADDEPSAWHPDADDLDIPDEASNHVATAFALMGVEPPLSSAHPVQRLSDGR